jgi:FkbH-like protein
MDSNVVRFVRERIDELGFNDYLKHVKGVEAASDERRLLKVAILRSYTLEQIEPVLRLRFLLDGFQPEFWIGGFDQYHQEVLDPNSGLHAFQPDLVLMMLRIEEVMPEFLDAFQTRTTEEWSEDLALRAEELVRIAGYAANELSAQVILQNMSPPCEGYFGIFDAQQASGQAQLLHGFNRHLTSVRDVPGVYLWDYDAFVRQHGYRTLFDPKMWYVSKNPFRQSAYPLLGGDLMRYVRSALGLIKKCVVLDLDNTLWGGIAGEDGMEGIELGRTYPGNCYRDFQKELLRLYHRGILLAINSKNNEEDALKIIENHPDMVLRRKHFAATRINWRDKASNMRELANELNIGIDSFVFLDDNPAECELIRQECPEVDVVMVPEKPYLIPQVVSRLPWMENIRLTAEDRRKGEMYRAQAARKRHEEGMAGGDLDAFLRSLEMEARIEAASPFSIPRISQLTQKTNQWNLTTRRYSESRIQTFASNPSWGVYAISAKDRFGDHGIIGVLMLRFDGTEATIDNFLLSCRVIGRGIENTMIAFASEVARAKGADVLKGEFIPTAKNAPAADFYERSGFEKVDDSSFQIMLPERTLPFPDYVRLTTESLTP